MTVGPAKVKACKSVVFTEGMPDVKIKRSLVNFVGLEKTVTKMVTMKSCRICIR